MFRRKPLPPEADAPPRPAPSERGGRDDGVHLVGETTGMFRARTAEQIQVEMENELDVEQLPEHLRKFLKTGRLG